MGAVKILLKTLVFSVMVFLAITDAAAVIASLPIWFFPQKRLVTGRLHQNGKDTREGVFFVIYGINRASNRFSRARNVPSFIARPHSPSQKRSCRI